MVGVASIGGCDGVVAPRLVARQDVQLGLDHDRGDAVLCELRRRNEFDLGNRPGGSKGTGSRRGRRAEEPLRHHHGRTGISRALATLADDHGRDRRLTREGPVKRRTAPRHSAVTVVAWDELRRGIQSTKDGEALQRLSCHHDELFGRLTDIKQGLTKAAVVSELV